MAARNVYFDPQCSLVFRNYLDNRAKYDGIGNYNAEGFAAMERAIPLAAAGYPQGARDEGVEDSRTAPTPSPARTGGTRKILSAA